MRSLIPVLALVACDDAREHTSVDATDTAEVDSSSSTVGSWDERTPLALARLGHSATRLDDDRILVAGGSPSLCPGLDDAVMASVEILAHSSPALADTVTPAAPMHVARRFHAALTLGSGVMVAGGETSDDTALASVERYDSATDTWTELAPLSAPARRLTLVAWGESALAFIDAAEGTRVELLVSGAWSPLALQGGPYLGAIALGDGRVMLLGAGRHVIVATDGTTTLTTSGWPELRGIGAAARVGVGEVLVVAAAETGDFTEAGPIIGTHAWRFDVVAERWTEVAAPPIGGALEALDTPTGEVLVRAGWGPWHLFDGTRWHALAFSGSVQQGPLVPLADGSLRLVGGSGDPTCAAVASVLVWFPDRP